MGYVLCVTVSLSGEMVWMEMCFGAFGSSRSRAAVSRDGVPTRKVVVIWSSLSDSSVTTRNSEAIIFLF